MPEWRLFPAGTIPEYTLPDWYAQRDRAPHLDEPAHRGRLELAAGMVRHAVTHVDPPTSLVDLGCGDGGLLSLIADVPGITAWGYDLQPSNITPAVNERGVDARYGDVVKGRIKWGEIAVATEMLEHLVDPHGYVRKIARHSRFLIASSPHTETDRDHYEFHTWAWDQDGYRNLLEQAGYVVDAHETTGMFQVILGHQPRKEKTR